MPKKNDLKAKEKKQKIIGMPNIHASLFMAIHRHLTKTSDIDAVDALIRGRAGNVLSFRQPKRKSNHLILNHLI